MPGVSVCMIVRNEEALLPDCLASLKAWVDEICIVDTGSTDQTLAIAQRFGARLKSVPWADDFAAARNQSLALATQPWILVVDADERLDPRTGPLLRQVIAQSRELAHGSPEYPGKPGGNSRSPRARARTHRRARRRRPGARRPR